MISGGFNFKIEINRYFEYIMFLNFVLEIRNKRVFKSFEIII